MPVCAVRESGRYSQYSRYRKPPRRTAWTNSTGRRAGRARPRAAGAEVDRHLAVAALGDDQRRDPPRLVEVGGVAGRLRELRAGDVGGAEQQGEHDQADAGVLGRCLSALAHWATLRG